MGPLPTPVAGWWTARRATGAALLAILIAITAFTFRFNALGGALAGFDNDHFTRLLRAEALLQGEQPLRDFADTELRGAWPALTYEVPAWTQRLFGRTFLSEAYVTSALITIAHVLVFLLALDLSRRWWVALLAVAAAIATMPKLHNYPKVLMLALSVWAVRLVIARPTTGRLAIAAVITALGTLFRHDQGVYIATALAVALIALEPRDWRTWLRRVMTYGAMTAVLLLPSAIWVQRYEGIPTYLQRALGTVAAERTRTPLSLPEFDIFAPLAGETPELVTTYYAFWGIPLLAAALMIGVLAINRRALSARDRAYGWGLIAMALLVNTFFLRANLEARFGDAAVPIVLIAAWAVAVTSQWPRPVWRRLGIALPALALALVLRGAYTFSDMRMELDTSGLSDSWGKTTRRYAAVRDDLGQLPPTVWTDAQARGTLRGARYVAECSDPADRVMVLGRLYEIPVYARRRFAAGQPLFELSLFLSDDEQTRAVDRLRSQSVPIIIADAEDFEDGFASDYPIVARYVREAYRDAGTIAIEGDPRLKVMVLASRQPVRSHPVFDLPCFR